MKRACLVFAVFLFAGFVPAGAQTDAVPSLQRAWVPATDVPLETLDLDSLKRGQKGYGLSVFAGTEPERFDVEVLGVWRNSKPELSYLLARLSGQGLEHSGILAGMSGSPVFVDEKLVGAVAFSFSFGKDPIAGITPIGTMRDIAPSAEAPGPGWGVGSLQPAASGSPVGTHGLWVPTIAELAAQDFKLETLQEHLAAVLPGASSDGGESRGSLAWTASGFAGTSRQLLANRFGGLAVNASLGSGSGDFDPALVPASLTGGDAVALMLMGGDLTLAAHGTVTDQHGPSILAFGHPIYSLGPIQLPMAESEVIATIPSVQSSFKLSNAGRLIGLFDQDREAGAHGRIGVEPPLVPVSVAIRKPGVAEESAPRDFQMVVADSYIFKPTLITLATLGSLNAVSHTSGYQGVDVRARFRIEGHDDLEVFQSFDGNQAAVDGALFLLGHAAFLELNELERGRITGVSVEVDQAAEPRSLELEEVRADRTRVEPGDEVTLHLGLRAFRGERQRRQMSVTIPDHIPEGRYYLMVGDGTSIDAARLMIAPAQPETLEQSLDLLRSFSSRKELRVLGLVAAKGLTLGGHTLPELPASMRSVLAEGRNVGAMELRVAGEWSEALERPMEGIHRVDLIVER